MSQKLNHLTAHTMYSPNRGNFTPKEGYEEKASSVLHYLMLNQFSLNAEPVPFTVSCLSLMQDKSVPSSIYGSTYFILIIFSFWYSAAAESSIEVQHKI